MSGAPVPDNEPARLAQLLGLQVLDSAPDEVLDGLVRCTALVLGYPVAMISLVDAERQWVMASHGLQLSDIPREHAFCAHALCGPDLFEVPDARVDPRFADNPLVVGQPHVRAYAGMPVTVIPTEAKAPGEAKSAPGFGKIRCLE